MEVSRREQWSSFGKGKSVVAVTDPTVRETVSTPMRRLGTQVRNKTPHQGIQFQPGGKTKTSAMSSTRWASTVKRRIRARQFGASLGMRILRTRILPAPNSVPPQPTQDKAPSCRCDRRPPASWEQPRERQSLPVSRSTNVTLHGSSS